MEKLRVLIVTHNYPISEKERRNAGIFVHDFAKELKKLGARVYVFCPSASRNIETVEGIPIRWFRWGNKKKSLRELKLWSLYDALETFVFFLRGIEASLKFANEVRPDLCVSMWAVPSGIFTYIINKRQGTPYAVWVLGSDIYVYSRLPVLGQIVQMILRRAKYLFADGIDLSRRTEGISGKKCLFLPSGTSFEPHVKKLMKKKDERQTTLTFIGRMELEKGPDLLLDALLGLKERNFKVNFLGDGSLFPQLKEKTRKRGASRFITFYGNVDNKNKIFNILSSSDWLVIPSRSDSIPLVFSETMKMGVPVIAAGLPDLKYFIDKYKVGLHFKPENKEELARIISNLPSRKERDIFSDNTKKVAKLFNLGNSAKKFLETVYD